MAKLQKCFKACLVSVSLMLVLLCLYITARPSMAASTGDESKRIPVGVLLDLNSTLGSILNNSLAIAVEDYYSVHNDIAVKIHLTVRHVSRHDAITAAGAAFDLMSNGKVHAMLGPQNSEQARYIVKLGEEFQVPVIWFPITGPSLLPPPYPYSHQGLNCFQFQAIADTIKAVGWQSIIPIYEKTEYGSHLVPCLTNLLKDMGIQMANVTTIDSDSTDIGINNTLDKLNSMQTHVFLVHMSIDIGTRFTESAEAKEMMGEGYTWILTQELSSLKVPPQVNNTRKLYHVRQEGYTNFTDHVDLTRYRQGTLGVRPMDLNKTAVRKERERNFTYRFQSSLTIYGWWAYHTLEALAMALEKPGTDNGPTLRNQILATNFKGESGLNFDLAKGQLDQSKFEVYNVIGTRESIVGYWSPATGLVQNYSSKSGETSGKYQLKNPLWLSDTLDIPQKLRIGVPTTNAFPEFVNIDTRIDGFAIDLFLKVVDLLPFQLNDYELVPLPNKNKSDPATYDEILCSQMKVEGLEAIIGDITILANREKCVDFTLPYLDSSVRMVVRVKNAPISRGILLKPFKWSLWLILCGIFVAATVIIILSEGYKNNERFEFNPLFLFTIDVTEKLGSISAGWMVILTSFLFILVLQIYTANLTLILTEGKMKEPSFEDENEIKSGHLLVGYQKGSWVRRFLINQIGFNSSQLKALESREEYNEVLSNGTVDAIFDETPYITLFLSRYKSHFIMAGQNFKTGGFGFAFSKNSSLVLHFSNAILKVTQDVESYRALMAKNSLPTSVEEIAFEDRSDDMEITSLGIASFGGLYPVLLFGLAMFFGIFIPDLLRRPVHSISQLTGYFKWIYS